MTGCALIGHGYWGTIIEKYLADAGFEKLYVYTRNSLVSYEQILADENVKVLFICTPASTHYELVKKALLAGKHVFCEKMLTGDAVKARELFQLAEAANKVLFTDYIYQYSPSVIKLVENAPRLKGKKAINAEISQYGKFYEDCGVMENIGVHMLTVIGMLTDFSENVKITSIETTPGDNGLPVETTASFSILEKGVSDLENQTAEIGGCVSDLEKGVSILENQVSVQLKASIISQGKTRKLSVLGENGSIHFDMMADPTVSMEIDGEKKDISFNEGDNLKTSLSEFATAILTGDYEINKRCCLYVENMVVATHFPSKRFTV